MLLVRELDDGGAQQGTAGEIETPAPLLAGEATTLVLARVYGQRPQVARELYLSESTVKYHLRTAMRKVGARDRAELVYKASELGLL